MSYIVQKAVQMNTVAGARATATFSKPLTTGNCIVVAACAVDVGAAVGADGNGDAYGSISDTQGHTFHSWFLAGPNYSNIRIYKDSANHATFWSGIYIVSPHYSDFLPGGADTVTFDFTPISVASNCQVGLVAYEVYGLDGPLGLDGAFGAEAWRVAGVSNIFPVATGMTGELVWSGTPYGAFLVECGMALTNDGSTLTSPSAPTTDGSWNLDGAAAASIGGSHCTIGVQSMLSSVLSDPAGPDLSFGPPNSGLTWGMSGSQFFLTSLPAPPPPPVSFGGGDSWRAYALYQQQVLMQKRVIKSRG